MELKDLEPFLEKIVKIDRTNEVPVSAKESYMGGYPFVPSNGQSWEWPLNEEGNPLVFIVQINFAEVPKGYGYPESGLFQVFVDLNEYGTMLEGGGLRVILYTAEDLALESVSRPSDIGPTVEDWTPFYEEYSPKKIGFREGQQIPSELLLLAEYYKTEDRLEPELKRRVQGLHEVLSNNGGELNKDFDFLVENHHQLGGEPHWIQDDMLTVDQNPTFMLQIDSDYLQEEFLLIGDAGNIHIFGDLDKLKEGDVSEFFWEWSCY